MTDTVLITGGTGLLGRALVRGLQSRGWQIVMTSRDRGQAEACASGFGTRVQGIGLDVADPGSIRSALRELRRRGVVVTHLVNNARSQSSLAVGSDGWSSVEDMLAEFGTSVAGPYFLIASLAKSPDHALRSVVNMGSQYGVVAMNPALYEGDLCAMPIQYGVAKAALGQLTRDLAARLAPRTRVNNVAFGGFAGRADQEFAARYSNMVPAGRMFDPRECVGPVHFLLSDDSQTMTGHTLVADGGWSII